MSEQKLNERIARLRAVFDDRTKEFRRAHAEALFNEITALQQRIEQLELPVLEALKLAEGDAGIDTVAFANALLKRVENQRREIERLHRKDAEQFKAGYQAGAAAERASDEPEVGEAKRGEGAYALHLASGRHIDMPTARMLLDAGLKAMQPTQPPRAVLPAPPKSIVGDAHLLRLADACERGVKAWQHMEEGARRIVADALRVAAGERSASQMLDALFAECPVQLWPDYSHGSSLSHPIEHNPAQERDERTRIEEELRLRMGRSKEMPLSIEDPSP